MMRATFFTITLLLLLTALIGFALPVSRAAAPKTEPTPRPDLELVGHIGGMGGDVLLSGNTLYWAQEYELAILDVSQPANPRRVGYLLLPGTIRDIDLHESYLYVIWQHRCLWGGCAATGEISIIDVSDPQHPYQAATYSLPALPAEMSIAEGYAYSLWTPSGEPQLSGMSILDLSDPLAPQPVSWVDFFNPVSVTVLNGYGYLSDTQDLFIYDLHDLANPVYLNKSPFEANRQMLIGDQYAYTIKPEWARAARVYDLSDPIHPNRISSAGTIGYGEGIAIENNFLYIAEQRDPTDSIGGGLQIVDILSPTHSVQVGYFDVPDGAASVAVGNGVAYLSTNYSGLKVIDVSNPAQPSLLAEWLVSGSINSLEVRGRSTFTATDRFFYGSGGLSIFNAANPTNPIGLGYAFNQYSRDVALDGNTAYLIGFENGVYLPYYDMLHVVDITDLHNPVWTGTYALESGRPFMELAAANGYVYITQFDKVLIADGRNPQHTLPPPIPANCLIEDVAIQDNRLYVADCGLRIFDLSDPANPAEIGSIGLPNSIQALDVAGQYAYLGGGNALYVIQITDPVSPTLRGWAALSTGEFDQIAAESGYVFIAGGAATGMYVVNAMNPDAPFESEIYPIEDFVRGIGVSGGYVYMAALNRGIFIFRFNPILHEQYLPLVRR